MRKTKNVREKEIKMPFKKIIDSLSNRYIYSIITHMLFTIVSLLRSNVEFYKYFLIMSTVTFSSLNMLVFNLKMINPTSLENILLFSFPFYTLFNIIFSILFLGKYIRFPEFIYSYQFFILILLFILRYGEFCLEMIYQKNSISLSKNHGNFKRLLTMLIISSLILSPLLFSIKSLPLFLIIETSLLYTVVYITIKNEKDAKTEHSRIIKSEINLFKKLLTVYSNNVMQRVFQSIARSYIALLTSLNFFFFFNIILYLMLPVSLITNFVRYKALTLPKDKIVKLSFQLIFFYIAYDIIANVLVYFYFKGKIDVFNLTISPVYIFTLILISIIWLYEQTIMTLKLIRKLFKTKILLLLLFTAMLVLSAPIKVSPFLKLTICQFIYSIGLFCTTFMFLRKSQ